MSAIRFLEMTLVVRDEEQRPMRSFDNLIPVQVKFLPL